MKLRRTIRFHHLTRNAVDEKSYPANQQYILYTHTMRSETETQPNIKEEVREKLVFLPVFQLFFFQHTEKNWSEI
jgi:hypothetical protein